MDVRCDPSRAFRVAGRLCVCRVGPRLVFLLSRRCNAPCIRSGRSYRPADARRRRRVLRFSSSKARIATSGRARWVYFTSFLVFKRQRWIGFSRRRWQMRSPKAQISGGKCRGHIGNALRTTRSTSSREGADPTNQIKSVNITINYPATAL